jgi:polysaccharide export outer membrane protein
MVAVVCLGAAGCMPQAGPSPQALFKTGNATDTSPFLLVKATPQVVKTIGSRAVSGFSGIKDNASSPRVTLGIGDVVTVTIFESSAGGLFIPNQSGSRPGNFVQLPDQNVDNSGNITVPYAGAIKAAGRSIPDIQDEIVARLRDRALEPQVVITLKDQKSTQVSVLGEVNGAGRFPINPAGDRLLDAIARAGGPKYPNYETNVSLQRKGREATISMNELVRDPGNNLYVRGGDIIVLSREARTYVVFGAALEEGRYDFEAEKMTVSDALGKARGLLDSRADPSDVFVYRLEDKQLLTRAGYDTSRFPGDRVPTIYSINLRDPNGYFLTSNFDIEDKDVLYIANAPIANVAKVFTIVRSGAQTVTSVKDPF